MVVIMNQAMNNKLFVFFIFIAVGLIIYSPMMNSPFTVLDDYYSIVENDQIRSPTALQNIFLKSFFEGNAYYRPIVSLSFLIEYQLFGLNPFYFHFTNFILHLLSAFFVFLLMEIIFKNRVQGFLVALLFLIHPIQTEAVSFIAGRSNLLSALFFLIALTLFCFLQGSANQGRKVSLAFASYFAFALALLSKESSVMLPIVLCVYTFCTSPHPFENWKKLLKRVAPYFIVLAGYLMVRQTIGVTEFYKPRAFSTVILAFVSFLDGVLEYFRILLLPVGLYFDRSHVLYLSWADPGVGRTLGIYVILIAGIFFFRRRLKPLSIFFLSWFFIDLFPVSQILMDIGVAPGFISTAEHFLYLPSVCFFALIVSGVSCIWNNAKFKKVISREILATLFAVYFAFLFCISLSQTNYSRHPIAVFQKSVSHNPQNSRIAYSLGVELAFQKRFAEAEKYFRQSIQSDPYEAIAYIGLGKALSDQGRHLEALEEYEKVRDAGRHQSILDDNYQKTLRLILGKYQARFQSDSANARLHYSIGIIYFKLKQYDKASAAYQESLRLDPILKEAVYNLGVSYEVLGEHEKAGEYYRAFLVLNEEGPLAISAREGLKRLSARSAQ
jgi:Flp pilus assembly protein TadD